VQTGGNLLSGQSMGGAVDAEMIRHKLELETYTADWPAMAPHFARGVVVVCGPELDVLDAAVALAQDDATTVAGWMASGALRKATDADGHAWTDGSPTFRFVIVAPFVVTELVEAS